MDEKGDPYGNGTRALARKHGKMKRLHRCEELKKLGYQYANRISTGACPSLARIALGVSFERIPIGTLRVKLIGLNRTLLCLFQFCVELPNGASCNQNHKLPNRIY